MAEIQRVPHVVPTPNVANEPHRIGRPGDGKNRKGDQHDRSFKDLIDLHDEDLEKDDEGSEAPLKPPPFVGPRPEGDDHIDIVV